MVEQIIDTIKGLDLLIVFVLVGVIWYQQRKITRLEAQVDLLVELNTDENDDPNGRGAVVDKLKKLQRLRRH